MVLGQWLLLVGCWFLDVVGLVVGSWQSSLVVRILGFDWLLNGAWLMVVFGCRWRLFVCHWRSLLVGCLLVSVGC